MTISTTTIEGLWFDGKTSACLSVHLLVDNTGEAHVVSSADSVLLLACQFADLRVSSRLGNAPRYLYFSQGQKFETADNLQVDVLMNRYRTTSHSGFLHQLETHSFFVLLTLLFLIGFSWAGVKFGLPAASKIIAYRLPQNIMNVASSQTLDLLDQLHMNSSALNKDTQARVLQYFSEALRENTELNIHVIFRAGGDLGANAFALPNGTIIFTDEMINLAKNDNELLAILAHEIGHVKYRHGLRFAIQSASVGFFVSMLVGDISGASGLLSALPVILTTMSYSRDFEREADENALDYLDRHKIPRHVFVDLMERVSYKARCDFLLTNGGSPHDGHDKYENHDGSAIDDDNSVTGDSTLTSEQAAAEKLQCDEFLAEKKPEGLKFTDYFSTHPETEERLQKFKQKFKQ